MKNFSNLFFVSLFLAAINIMGCGGGGGSNESSAADTTPPTVVSTAPSDSTLTAAVKPGIKAVFSEGLSSATTTSASFIVTKGTGTPVPGTVAYNAATHSVSFTPTNSRLDYGTLYTAMVTTAVRDAAGNALAAPYTWSFTTKTNLMINAGSVYSMALQNDGTVWSWGEASSPFGGLGRDLGASASDPVPAPISIPTATTIKLIATGENHTVVVDAENNLYAWGDNYFRQLGAASLISQESFTPVLVSMPSLSAGVSVIAVSSSKKHSLALTSDGSVYAWGDNNVGELGLDTIGSSHAPALVTNLSGTTIVAIAAGTGPTSASSIDSCDFSLALDSTGKVWAWGCNESGQVANPEDTNYHMAPAPLAGLPSVKAIAAGYGFGAAVATNGDVWTWGYGIDGNLGDGTCGPGHQSPAPAAVSGISLVSKVAAGRFGANGTWVIALKDNGTIWGWGDDSFGQLGNNSTGSNADPLCPGSVTYPVRAGNLTNVIDIATGSSHSIALKSDGTVWVWGNNDNNRLGVSTSTPVVSPKLVPVQVPNF